MLFLGCWIHSRGKLRLRGKFNDRVETIGKGIGSYYDKLVDNNLMIRRSLKIYLEK